MSSAPEPLLGGVPPPGKVPLRAVASTSGARLDNSQDWKQASFPLQIATAALACRPFHQPNAKESEHGMRISLTR
ncbi:hypothetical protein CgunFtcFv8_015554 [Champsocephalus gunnari]|uniref:Uncharacterized protein n=1 Tax=Champsocephalus gunnari TaxID=52237 RepID=A0AAN8C957_CHAGU|nr:hypothetical protein CgunFtcFv8_015554 [Champsocephalus gunnari]